ncbi:MAG: TonB-dependent receptor [Bacteroidales bacterium]|nr:TonB-dependent receptor [Bacteroidales bacterium]
MKITTFLIFIFGLNVSASLYSQTKRFTFDSSNRTIKEVLGVIEAQSDFRFFYNDKFLDLNRVVNLSVDDMPIEVVLDHLVAEADIAYKLLDNNLIVFTPRENLQQGKVTGRVTDAATGVPLPGVYVRIDGSNTGGITDAEGNYSVDVPSSDAALVFSYIGYNTETIIVDGRTVIDVNMIPEISELEEIVVIGYGTRQKKDLTGAVTQISSKELASEVKMTPQQSLQGKMAGVFISNTGSDPTARADIMIRGVTTMYSTTPLYVIDGIPAVQPNITNEDFMGQVDPLSLINPNDIESVSVLKDASAAAIYGVRASNGVVLITTKRGNKDRMQVSVNGRFGVQNIYKRYDVLGVQDYVDIMNEGWANNPLAAPDPRITAFYDTSDPEYLGSLPRVDWTKEAVAKNALIQDYDVSVSGGNEKVNYSMGVGYANQENAIYKSSYDRYSFYVNSDHKINKWIKAGETLRLGLNKWSVPNYTAGATSAASYTGATFTPPWQPLFDEDGVYGFANPVKFYSDGTKLTSGYGPGTSNNFLGLASTSIQQRSMIRTLGSVYVELSPLPGLRVKGTFSFDRYTNDREKYQEEESGYFSTNFGSLTGLGNTYEDRRAVEQNLVTEFLVGYSKSMANHNIDFIFNITQEKSKGNVLSLTLDNNSDITSWQTRKLANGAPSAGLSDRVEKGLLGYMGRLSYNYNSKYYLDATLRRDGSSNFSPGYKWGTFPSFAAAWRVSAESFMKNITWLNDLKIRAGWGQIGNQNTGAFSWLSLVNLNPRYTFGTTINGLGNLVNGSFLGDFTVTDLSWEVVTTSNIGFDAVVLKNKLTFTAEYYYKFTDGIIQIVDIPYVTGTTNSPSINLAQLSNKGFEFQGTYTDKIGKLGYNLSFNLTTVKNNVKKIYKSKPQEVNGDSNYRIEEGYEFGYIYGYKTDGIFQTDQEVADWKAQVDDPDGSQLAPGDIRFKDLYGPYTGDAENVWKSGEPDGVLNAYDKTYLGKTIPGFYYGFNMGLSYSNWDISVNFRGVGDVQKINTVRMQGENLSNSSGNQLATVKNRWTTSNHSNSMPRALADDPVGNNRMSDRWVEDAGFLRLQSAQLGYTFPNSLLSKFNGKNLRVYVSGSNLFVITPYSGLDPEDDTTPVTFIGGINLTF